MNKKNTEDIFDLLLMLEDKDHEIRSVFGDTELLGDPISLLWKIILEKYGFPKDNTVEMGEKYGDLETAEKKDDKFFCNDYLVDKLFDFGERKISKKTLVKFLEKESAQYKK